MKVFDVEKDKALNYQVEDSIWSQFSEYTIKRETAFWETKMQTFFVES